MRKIVLALAAVLALSACQTTSPSATPAVTSVLTPAMLVEQGARPVPGNRLASIFSDQTVYVRFTSDYRTMKAGEPWVEYYAPNGDYYYKDRVDTLRSQWAIEGDELIFTEKGKKYYTTVYEQNGTYYFVYLNDDKYKNQAIGRTTRFVKGNVEPLKTPSAFDW